MEINTNRSMKIFGKQIRFGLEEGLTLFCLVVFGFIVSYIVYAQFAYYWSHLHTDIAADLLFVREARSHGTLFPEGWFHLREVRLMHLTTPILLFYMITDNLHLSYQLASTFMLFINIALFYYMLSYKKIRLLPIFIGLISLLALFATMPINTTETFTIFDILFVNSSYSLHLASIFFTIGAYMRLKTRGSLHIAIWMLVFMLAFAQGFQSDRLVVALYAPILFIELIYMIRSIIDKQAINKKNLLFAGSMLMLSLGGAFLVKFLFSRGVLITDYTHATGLYMVSNAEIWYRLGVLTSAIMYSFGAIGREGVFTAVGLLHFSRLAIIAIVAFVVMKIRHGKPKDCLILAIVLLSVIFSSALMLFVDLEITSRYIFYTLILISVAAVVIMQHLLENSMKIFASTACVAVCILSLFSLYALPFEHRPIVEHRQAVADFISEQDISIGYGTFWQGPVIAAVANFEFDVLAVNLELTDVYKFGTSRDLLHHQNERTFLITTLWHIDNFGWHESVYSVLAEGQRYDFEGGWLVYIFEKNPFVLEDMTYGN